MRRIEFVVIFLFILFSSCSRQIYLKDMHPGMAYESNKTELKIREGDQLSIEVKAKDPEVTIPFNKGTSLSYNPVEVLSEKVGGTQGASLYEVLENGEIDFPVLGKIQVKGKTCKAIAAVIEDRLIRDQYIANPSVEIEIFGGKIYLMGQVASTGALPIEGKGMNLLEALTLSGGVSGNADWAKVRVIRNENGAKKLYETDIRSTDLFTSPCFALQQGDIVYVPPRTAIETERERRAFRYFGTLTSLASLIVSALILTR